MLQTANTHRQLKSAVIPASLSLPNYSLMCMENGESWGSVKYLSFPICVQESAALLHQGRSSIVLTQWVLFGSDIFGNYVKMTLRTLAVPLPYILSGSHLPVCPCWDNWVGGEGTDMSRVEIQVAACWEIQFWFICNKSLSSTQTKSKSSLKMLIVESLRLEIISETIKFNHHPAPPAQSPLNPALQCHMHTHCEQFQWWGLHHFLGKSIPGLDNLSHDQCSG